MTSGFVKFFTQNNIFTCFYQGNWHLRWNYAFTTTEIPSLGSRTEALQQKRGGREQIIAVILHFNPHFNDFYHKKFKNFIFLIKTTSNFSEVDKGKFAATDTFKNYEVIYDNKEAILLTDHRIIYTVKNDLFGGWQTEWSYQWSSFSSVMECDRGIELILAQTKNSKSKLKQMFSNSEVGKKIIFVSSLEKRTRLVAIINQLITSYTSP